MNILSKISIMALTVAASSNVAANAEEQEIITRPAYEVVNGQLTPELLEAFGRVSEPKISPDKKQILYTVEFVSCKADKGNKELWVMNIDGSNQRKLTNTAEPELNAEWINGGKEIAFLSVADKQLQLFVMNSDGSNRRQISNVDKGINGFVLSPDEKKILFIGNVKYGKTVEDNYPNLD